MKKAIEQLEPKVRKFLQEQLEELVDYSSAQLLSKMLNVLSLKGC